jgi:N6-L-threonylcarbamoyladenine synthase
MKILSIETSCDETAVALLECEGDPRTDTFSFKVLGNALNSQISSHEQFGGVVPMLAKREHAKNLIPLFKDVFAKVFLSHPSIFKVAPTSPGLGTPTFKNKRDALEKLSEIFGREEEFKNDFIALTDVVSKIPIDAIAVTQGPGLEPALWMGIIFAQALSLVYDIPLIPVNHMEGHIMSVLPQKITFPALALLISGGHTELVLMKEWHHYEVIGHTRDDAVGEAFDKVARMLELPYPGGPQISHLAELQRKTQTSTPEYILPRPMIHSKDFDFSFSGIKTAVLYSLKEKPMPTGIIAKEFEEAVTEVLISKTFRAIDEFNIKTLIIGGGVISNEYIRKEFSEKASQYNDLHLLLPDKDLRTDNALMIGLAGYLHYLTKQRATNTIAARGNLSF